MVTSLNQVRHLYVAKALKTASGDTPASLVNKGDLIVKTVGTLPSKEMYFEILGADTPLKSDRIPVKNIVDIKAIKASSMETPMKKVLVTVDPSLLSNGSLKYTEDYVLRIVFRQFYGMSDQDKYIKDVAVHGVAGTTATNFYAALVTALNQGFSREIGANATSNPYLSFSSSANGLVIEEKPQPWTLGVQSQERVYFEVVPTTIYNAAVGDVDWGTSTVQTSTTSVGNGKKIADLEYFLLGERGDQYRKIGWPNDIETKGLVDPTLTYNVIEIHYTFSDTGVNNYNTEKQLTLVVPVGVSGHEYDVVNAIIGAINTATGLNTATLS